SQGIKYPKTSKHLKKLYVKKNNCIKDYIHKMTRYITDYCVSNGIYRVVAGDIKGIRKKKDLGAKTNQKLHSLPYARIYKQLEYKLKLQGIKLIKQEERYTSQCPPESKEVSRACAKKENRKKRGLFFVDDVIYNADAVGAYNILRKYNAKSGKTINMPISGLKNTIMVKVAV
ncbi:MAG: transposase, partial [Lachnospiraceae bacterium]|nr:transposase [Lachnospiraceae bacterium]